MDTPNPEAKTETNRLNKYSNEFVAAIIAALLLEVLIQILKRNGVVLESLLQWTGMLSFALGVSLLVHLLQNTAKNSHLWLVSLAALVAFGFSAVVLVVAARPSSHSYDVVEYSTINWSKLAKEAESRVLAEGLVLEPTIDIGTLVQSLEQKRNLNIKVVIADPEGRALSQRATDENPNAPPENRARLIEKIRNFQAARNGRGSDIWRDRFQLLVRDTYPTIAVVVVDDTLYAYLYSFRKKGTDSPVFCFQQYKKANDPLARFFENHLLTSLDSKQGAYDPRDYTVTPNGQAATGVPVQE